jgi:hypothetical protein
MRPAFPTYFLVNQAQVCFMQETSGLQSVGTVFTPQVAAGQAVQFIVNQRHQGLESLRVSITPFEE